MTSYQDKRQGFTLVELLVVITIIGLLAGMLIPAVNYAREAARRAQCINHQRNLVIAMSSHAANEGALPGSFNQLGTYKNAWTNHANDTVPAGASRVFSWVVALMPYIEENARYEIFMADDPNATQLGSALGRIPVLFCTSARLDSFTPNNDPRLSYVVNCGPEADSGNGTDDIDGHTSPAFTIFRDRRNISGGSLKLTSLNKKFKLEDINDGASNTILLSENIQSWAWYISANDNLMLGWDGVNELEYTSGSDSLNTRGSTATACLGFVWSNRQTVPGTYDFLSKINDGASEGPRSNPPQTTSVYDVRPSSMHPGLVVMGYADGTVRVMNDDVGRGPYLKAVCPNDTQALNNTNTNSTPGNGLGYVSNDFIKETW